MVAGQRLIASDGKEIMLFPLSYLYISQDEGGSYSHSGILAMDFLGWGANGRIYNCPYYAPCKCKLVYKQSSAAYNIWESVDKVHTPIGLTYVSFWVQHDDNLPYTVGTVLNQGDLLGHTGTAGYATGDHLHFNVANSKYEGQEQVSSGEYQLRNSKHIYDMCYVNNTIVIEGLNHNWLIYGGKVISLKKNKFKWVLYARKLRNNKLMFDKIKK